LIRNEKGLSSLYITKQKLDEKKKSIQECKGKLYSYQFGFIHSEIVDS